MQRHGVFRVDGEGSIRRGIPTLKVDVAKYGLEDPVVGSKGAELRSWSTKYWCSSNLKKGDGKIIFFQWGYEDERKKANRTKSNFKSLAGTQQKARDSPPP